MQTLFPFETENRKDLPRQVHVLPVVSKVHVIITETCVQDVS